ncbi:hypothetical protein cyc_04868 [Cyclospora cayetanensis]|uniref:Uncharacterized protein n=1 Tax=Cyclospora cayetanensis TaxID=88456 RepID=A0A1D3CZT8_9EIME|nr:hypothetical protein cyc_04868 [Cyclospora cayetanensis]
MEAVQRSLAAAAWRQCHLEGHLQGVVEEEEEEEEGAQQQQQQQQRHLWGSTSPASEPVAQPSCVVRVIFGSYSHRGVMHDNEDRICVGIWGRLESSAATSSPSPSPPSQQQQRKEQEEEQQASSQWGSCSSQTKPSAPTPNTGADADRSILELAAGGRGLEYQWNGRISAAAAGAAAASATAAATLKADETVCWGGQHCRLPPVVAAGVRVAVQGGFAAELRDMQEEAAAATVAEMKTAVDGLPRKPPAFDSAAIDAAINRLVEAPRAPSCVLEEVGEVLSVANVFPRWSKALT